jgi:hypothetical protein
MVSEQIRSIAGLTQRLGEGYGPADFMRVFVILR